MKVEDLLALDEDTFRVVVDSEVRNFGIRNPEEKPTEEQLETVRSLRDARLNTRWGFALIAMKKSVESQLGAKRSDLEKKRAPFSEDEFDAERSEFFRWRAGALRFKSGVEERLLLVRSQVALASPNIEALKRDRNEAITRETLLRNAIASHQTKVLNEYDPSDADLELWGEVEDGSPVPY